MQAVGVFILAGTRKSEKQILLGWYFASNQIEEIFKIGKDGENASSFFFRKY